MARPASPSQAATRSDPGVLRVLTSAHVCPIVARALPFLDGSLHEFSDTVGPPQSGGTGGFLPPGGGAKLSPLWLVLQSIASNEPKSLCVPALWRYADVRPYLMEASEVITPEEAERRVMVLENPGMNRGNRITHSLYAGLQIVLPGEIAPPHRHTANALRFIIEGNGAYTSVDGKKPS